MEQARLWLCDQPVGRGLGFRREDSLQRDQAKEGEPSVSFLAASETCTWWLQDGFAHTCGVTYSFSVGHSTVVEAY